MRKLYTYVCKAEVFIAATCFAISCVIIFMGAVARTMDRPINWSQDLSLFLFAWSVFLSADAALRENRLVSVDMLVNRFPEKTKRIVAFVNYSIILIFLVIMVFFGIKLSIFSRSRVFQGIPGFSYSWVSMSLPVGSFLQIITVLLKLKNLVSVKGREPVESEA